MSNWNDEVQFAKKGKIAGAGHGESQFNLFRYEENIVLWAVSEAEP